jgi:hypothetical protein
MSFYIYQLVEPLILPNTQLAYQPSVISHQLSAISYKLSAINYKLISQPLFLPNRALLYGKNNFESVCLDEVIRNFKLFLF